MYSWVSRLNEARALIALVRMYPSNKNISIAIEAVQILLINLRRCNLGLNSLLKGVLSMGL